MRLTEQKKRKTKFFLFCFVQGHLTINNKKNKRKGVLFVRGFSFWRLSLEGMLIKLHATRHFSGSCPDVRPPPNKFVSPCNNTKHFQKNISAFPTQFNSTESVILSLSLLFLLNIYRHHGMFVLLESTTSILSNGPLFIDQRQQRRGGGGLEAKGDPERKLDYKKIVFSLRLIRCRLKRNLQSFFFLYDILRYSRSSILRVL